MAAEVWVVCLCAQWCHVCRGLQPVFAQMHQRLPEVRWAWLDIEDHDEALGELDITTFPTYLIGSDQGVLHFAAGPTHADALEYFVRPYLRGAVAPQALTHLLHLVDQVRFQALKL
ncbi:thioredoxin family protein [Macromonas nakdongensis]|uniref:thioredoxin family protein n=1 Tax=Macromonas nakdongensis TaxID=1843082 RepID=UPI000C32273A|nr:thioredoxin family protein [Macromonas nakdongensis]